MSEWIVKDEDYVPLPPHHVLRHGIDWAIAPYGVWHLVRGFCAGRRVDSVSTEKACCRASDWPKKLGPLPRKPIERLQSSQPVESPDDWVTQDRVPPREGIDQVSYSNWPNQWVMATGSWVTMHAELSCGGTISVRCRRKDLPPLFHVGGPYVSRSKYEELLEENRGLKSEKS